MKKNTVFCVSLIFIINIFFTASATEMLMSSGNSYVDFSMLNSEVSSAMPGDEFIIRNGTYENIEFAITGEGSKESPVIIKAETPGGVILTGKTNITISGKYIVLSGFRFENTRSDTNIIKLDSAVGCRITECYFYNVFGETSSFVSCITAYNISKRNRIDHNVFETTGGGFSVVVGFNENAINTDNVVDHNYFKDVPEVSSLFPGETNGFEQVGAGTDDIHQNETPRLVIEDNLFENIVGDKSEIICIKSSENIVRQNTFLNCSNSGPDFRIGHRNIFDGNFSINSKNGMRLYGSGHFITNNYFYKCARGIILSTTNERDVRVVGEGYPQLRNIIIEGNVIIDSGSYGINYGGGFNPISGYMDVPEKVTMQNNTIVSYTAPALINSNISKGIAHNNNLNPSGFGITGKEIKGFDEKNVNLVFDGEIYVPKDMKIDKRGLKTYKDVGPNDRYWEALLKNSPDDIGENLKEPDMNPDSYISNATKLVLAEGETYDLSTLTGTAEYGNEKYRVLPNNIIYSVLNEETAAINGKKLIALNEGETKLKAVYKDKITYIAVSVIPNSVSEESEIMYINNFDSSDSLSSTVNKSRAWQVRNGVLTNSGVSSPSSRMIIDNSAYLKGDFTLSCELTPKSIEETDEGNVDGSIIIGYKESPLNEYYRIGFGSNPDNSINVIEISKNGVIGAIGIVEAALIKNQTHIIKVTKIKDKLSVYVDERLVGIADVPENLEGKIGFASNKIAEFDNIVIEKAISEETPEVSEMYIETERTDVNEICMSYQDVGNALYRIYKNGLWIFDTTKTQFFDNYIRMGDKITYEVKAFDQKGSLIAQGELLYNHLGETPSELFQITNCKVRLGTNGEYLENVYYPRNKGLSSDQRIYYDRVYTWGDIIPEEFENAAYIMTRNSDVYNPLMQSADTEDFIIFDINKSATVYLLVYPNKSTVEPGWLNANGWQKVDDIWFGEEFTLIYKKHYQVDNGKATVKIGGRQGKLPIMYSIVVKKD